MAPVSWLLVRHFAVIQNLKMNLKQVAPVPWVLVPPLFSTSRANSRGSTIVLFVTVQVLDETPAVLSPGNLCEDHGYSYEWVSGQKPRLTQDGKTYLQKR